MERQEQLSEVRLEDRHLMIDLAKRLYRMRGRRASLFGVDPFGEPAWDMLLDLFISESEGKALSVSSLSLGSRSSPATALRYLSALEAEALVERIPDDKDGRRSFVSLTSAGRRGLLDLLRELVSTRTPP